MNKNILYCMVFAQLCNACDDQPNGPYKSTDNVLEQKSSSIHAGPKESTRKSIAICVSEILSTYSVKPVEDASANNQLLWPPISSAAISPSLELHEHQ